MSEPVSEDLADPRPWQFSLARLLSSVLLVAMFLAITRFLVYHPAWSFAFVCVGLVPAILLTPRLFRWLRLGEKQMLVGCLSLEFFYVVGSIGYIMLVFSLHELVRPPSAWEISLEREQQVAACVETFQASLTSLSSQYPNLQGVGEFPYSDHGFTFLNNRVTPRLYIVLMVQIFIFLEAGPSLCQSAGAKNTLRSKCSLP